MFTVDRNGDGVVDAEDDGVLPYGAPVWQNPPNLSQDLRNVIEGATGQRITCLVCLQTLQGISAADSAEDVAKKLLPHLQLTAEVREAIGGIASQQMWLIDLVRPVLLSAAQQNAH